MLANKKSAQILYVRDLYCIFSYHFESYNANPGLNRGRSGDGRRRPSRQYASSKEYGYRLMLNAECKTLNAECLLQIDIQ